MQWKCTTQTLKLKLKFALVLCVVVNNNRSSNHNYYCCMLLSVCVSMFKCWLS